jgi:outer membrane receptor for ferrienterochelin and colicin
MNRSFKDDNNNTTQSNSNIQWGNATVTLRWNHLINEKIFSNVSLIYTNFLFDIGFDEIDNTNSIKLKYFSGIRDYTVKGDIDFYPNAKHTVKTGITATYHYFRPSAVVSKDTHLNTDINKVTHIDAYETAIYFEDDYKISEKWRASSGLRLSNFNVRSKSYFNPEPRISLRYAIKKNLSIKASYASMNQYLHLLSNSGIGLPSDLWVPATDRIKPQKAQQVALGLAQDLKIKDADFLVSLEGYYKKSQHIIGYKEGASFLNVTNIDPSASSNFTYEDIVTSGKAESYGAEFFFQKKSGKLTGWVGYTLSWTWLTFNELNFGKRFPARYDRRHDISIVGIYKLNDHISLSAIWVYGSGNAITLPTSSYQLVYQPTPYSQTPSASAIAHGYNDLPSRNNNTATVYDYGDKNSFRMAAYHRLDIAVQFHKKKKKYERIFELGFYNAYNRQNPFFYTTNTDYQTNTTKLIQVSLFPVIPSVSWTWKF